MVNTARANTYNEAGGRAYALSDKDALTQLVLTGCFNAVAYSSAEELFTKTLDLTSRVEDEFLARLAVYARVHGGMKDTPAFLLAILAKRNTQLFRKVFSRVVINGKILRSLIQILRSGKINNSKGLNSCVRTSINNWLNERSYIELLNLSIGNHPKLRDIFRLTHPKTSDPTRNAAYRYLTSRQECAELPEEFLALRMYNTAETAQEQVSLLQDNLQGIRWDLLTAKAKEDSGVWREIVNRMGSTALRMNLQTMARHHLFDDTEFVSFVARKLSSREEILKAKEFPYRYYAAYKALYEKEGLFPEEIIEALDQATLISCEGVSDFGGRIAVCLDVSGSMSCPVTGYRVSGKTTRISCREVAAVFAGAILVQNPGSFILPFDTDVHQVCDLSDFKNINELAFSFDEGGGTDCSVALQYLVSEKYSLRGVVMISDDESWVGPNRAGCTATLKAWNSLRKINPEAKMVCLNLQPYDTTQAPNTHQTILNLGGFSSSVFETMSKFFKGVDETSTVNLIEAVDL